MLKEIEMEEKKYSFYQHKDCEFFPCHKTEKPESFNCLFCYCPLYALGENCGGNFRYLENGVKDCSACLVPHTKGRGYDYIMSRYGDIVEKAKKK
ncbi:MAG: cysteine-rich small domain-containing protein [Clostridia bacterium]|nr:cysteine-rich small domain-containing protein [Clostridia bacterium]